MTLVPTAGVPILAASSLGESLWQPPTVPPVPGSRTQRSPGFIAVATLLTAAALCALVILAAIRSRRMPGSTGEGG